MGQCPGLRAADLQEPQTKHAFRFGWGDEDGGLKRNPPERSEQTTLTARRRLQELPTEHALRFVGSDEDGG